ncbi:hypothetical protein SDC9_93442 [bioreactor metagenome]|uniref:Uncharacterized protein n=1 Tax=bioreactor metagenome TaxID=1076179 RepID=A0A645A1E5_9ZZZZ
MFHLFKQQVLLHIEDRRTDIAPAPGNHHAQGLALAAQVEARHPLCQGNVLFPEQWFLVDDAFDRLDLVGRFKGIQYCNHIGSHLTLAERNHDALADADLNLERFRDGVGVGIFERKVQDHFHKLGHHDLPFSGMARYAATFFRSSQTARLSCSLRSTPAG